MLDLSEFSSLQIFFVVGKPRKVERSVSLERKNARKGPHTHGTRYFVYVSWINPSWEQRLTIRVQAMYIACNDTSVIVINFRKSKTHAITDTYCTLLDKEREREREREKGVVTRASLSPFVFLSLSLFLFFASLSDTLSGSSSVSFS